MIIFNIIYKLKMKAINRLYNSGNSKLRKRIRAKTAKFVLTFEQMQRLKQLKNRDLKNGKIKAMNRLKTTENNKALLQSTFNVVRVPMAEDIFPTERGSSSGNVCLKLEEEDNKDYILDVIGNTKTILDQREEKLRKTAIALEKNLVNKYQGKHEEYDDLYNKLLENVKQIYDKIKNDINEKKKEVLENVDLQLYECASKQQKLIDEKIAEQEILLGSLNHVTYNMQRVKDNYDILRKKIRKEIKTCCDYEQKLEKEKNKKTQLLFLLGDYKYKNKIMIRIMTENEKYKDIEEEMNRKFSDYTEEDILSEHTNKEKNKFANLETDVTANKYLNTSNCENDPRSIAYITKQINALKSKTKRIQTLEEKTIPNKPLYTFVNQIMKETKNMKEFAGLTLADENIILNSMKTIPYHSQSFRNAFMEKIFSDKELLKLLDVKEYNYFRRGVFGRKELLSQ